MRDRIERPHLFVVFGVTGDLAHRKLLPALFRAFERHEGVERCFVLGAVRRRMDEAALRDQVIAAILESHAQANERAVRGWAGSHVFLQRVTVDRTPTASGTANTTASRH